MSIGRRCRSFSLEIEPTAAQFAKGVKRGNWLLLKSLETVRPRLEIARFEETAQIVIRYSQDRHRSFRQPSCRGLHLAPSGFQPFKVELAQIRDPGVGAADHTEMRDRCRYL